MDTIFRFQPVSHSWVAVHPNPKGIIQFLGGAFFGTFPTVFYCYFLRKLFEEGYTIVAIPFKFSFRHWSVAISLLREQSVLALEISKIAKRLNYQTDIYQDKTKFFWIGHSLGTKYITLLEFLSSDIWKNILEECTQDKDQVQWIEDSIKDIQDTQPSIKGQASLLIAPNISDIENAIPKPLAFLAYLIDKLKLEEIPTKKQTQCFIERSNLFNLTGLISFNKDTIAGSETDLTSYLNTGNKSDVLWFIEQLKHRKFSILHQEIPGKHLEPIGIKIGNYIVNINSLNKFIEPIQSRQLEHLTAKFLDELSKRQEQLSLNLLFSNSSSCL